MRSTVHRFQSQITSSTVPVCMCQGNFRANPGWNYLLSSWDALPFISDAQMLPLQKKVVKANKTNNGEIRWGSGHEPRRCNSPSLSRKKWNLDFTSFRLWREKGNKIARPFLQVQGDPELMRIIWGLLLGAVSLLSSTFLRYGCTKVLANRKKRISKISQKLTELDKKDYGCFKGVRAAIE